ncbi:hypothetical protein M3J09_009697 [Ascochyta lentis]
MLMRDDVVKIEIGPDHMEYFVHPGLLLEHSEYFNRALTGSWKEAAERAIELDDVDFVLVEIFLEWLYTQRYPKDNRFTDSFDSECASHLARVKACEFGDRFLAAEFRRASENALIDSLTVGLNTPWYTMIIYAFNHLPPNSPVLQAMIDTHCYSWKENSDNYGNGELQLRSLLPHSFLLGVALRYMRLQHGRKKRLDRCDYHGHGPDDDRGDKCQVARVDEFNKRKAT